MIEALTELIRLTATDLPRDVEGALRQALLQEEPNSAAHGILTTIVENITLARQHSLPLCQDTGMLNFYVAMPFDMLSHPLEEQIREAVRVATVRAYLRPNCVDPRQETNTGDNVGGDDFPFIHIARHEEQRVIVDLLLKGGGSENVGAQYMLPHQALRAERDWEGVRRVVLHSIVAAQGNGCAPGIIGVAIGGDRASGYGAAKKALLRRVGERHPNPMIATWEEGILRELNTVGNRTHGLRGGTTVLDVHAAVLHRHPACYFVSIAYACWACRRHRLIIDGKHVQFL